MLNLIKFIKYSTKFSENYNEKTKRKIQIKFYMIIIVDLMVANYILFRYSYSISL